MCPGVLRYEFVHVKADLYRNNMGKGRDEVDEKWCVVLYGDVTRKLPRGVSAHSERKWRRVISIENITVYIGMTYIYQSHMNIHRIYITIDTVMLLHMVDSGEPHGSFSGTSSLSSPPAKLGFLGRGIFPATRTCIRMF